MKTIKTLLSAAAFTTLLAASSTTAHAGLPTDAPGGSTGPATQLPAEADQRIAAFLAAWERGVPTTDLNRDGGIDGTDLEVFFHSLAFPITRADFNADGVISSSDLQLFLFAWTAGVDSADINLDGGNDHNDLEAWFDCAQSVNIETTDWSQGPVEPRSGQTGSSETGSTAPGSLTPSEP